MSTEQMITNIEGGDTAVVYEVGYLLLPTLAEEQLEGTVGDIKGIITGKGGSIISEDFPAMRALAYTMPKIIATKRQTFDHAYFGSVKFEASTSHIAEIKKNIEALDSILRSLFIKTIRENTSLSSKVQARDEEKDAEKKEGGGVTSGEIKPENSEEEIDKSIDALVTS